MASPASRPTPAPASVNSSAGPVAPAPAQRMTWALPALSVQPKDPDTTPSTVVPGWLWGNMLAPGWNTKRATYTVLPGATADGPAARTSAVTPGASTARAMGRAAGG